MLFLRTSHDNGDTQRLGQSFERLAFGSVGCRTVGVVVFCPCQPGCIRIEPDVKWVSWKERLGKDDKRGAVGRGFLDEGYCFLQRSVQIVVD